MIKPNISLLIWFFTIGFLGLSCSDSYIDNVQRGGWYKYEAGLPELRLSTTGYYSQLGVPTIEVSGDVVYGGLLYRQNDEGKIQADISVEIILRDRENEAFIAEETFSKSLIAEDNSVIHSQDLFRFTEIFEVDPGEYEVSVTVTDESSGKQMVRNSNTIIEDIDDGIVSISEVQIFGKENAIDGAEFIPVTTYDVPTNLDSLKFMVQINNSTGTPINIRSNLKKFVADTSIAWPMSIQDYPRSSIRFQGIEYDEFEIIQSGSRRISQNGNIFIEYSYGQLELGNYRLEVFIEADNDLKTEGGREFGIKPAFYPAIKTTRQMAEPLAYIMTDSEYEELMSIENDDSLKVAMDRFWLSNVNNSNLAEDVISLYYTRVEEANKQFSNYKEGWKTDMGRAYIVFGPPLKIDDALDRNVTWLYTYDMFDTKRNFMFSANEVKNKYYPFDNYILERDIRLFSVEYNQVNRWRSGSVIYSN